MVLPENILYCLNTLERSGCEAWVVGGWVCTGAVSRENWKHIQSSTPMAAIRIRISAIRTLRSALLRRLFFAMKGPPVAETFVLSVHHNIGKGKCQRIFAFWQILQKILRNAAAHVFTICSYIFSLCVVS